MSDPVKYLEISASTLDRNVMAYKIDCMLIVGPIVTRVQCMSNEKPHIATDPIDTKQSRMQFSK